MDPRAREIIRSHHEKLDGSGYPDGLKGDKISKLTRIITIADIFDALTSSRPYRISPTSEDQAVVVLQQEADAGKLDPEIVALVVNMFKSGSIDLNFGL